MFLYRENVALLTIERKLAFFSVGINLGRNLMRRKKIIRPEFPAVENLVVFLYALTQSVLVTL